MFKQLLILMLALGAARVCAEEAEKAAEPFAFADFTWLNGNSRIKDPVIQTKYFTGQFMLDTNYVYDFNHPKDHTLSGSCELGRSNEMQVQQLGVGGDFNYENVRGRLMTQFGMYSQQTPRNDASPEKGQWHLDDAYRYISEAYGGYHWDVLNGVNLDAGIFMSYVGLFSYYQSENWAYQPSYVSANTPWFFNGLRLQVFPTDKFKVEFWLVNGWQSYGKFNDAPGLGTQLLWRPNGSLQLLSNDYYGYDTFGASDRMRIHSDNSLEVKYYDRPSNFVSKAAFSLTGDAGCESGDGVSCMGSGSTPGQYFLGGMFYNRVWFDHDQYAITVGGGAINNPGRYLVLIPPSNGDTAFNHTYFSANPGDPFHAWDASVTFDIMPKQYITWRFEYNHRAADVPYFAGPGGLSYLSGGANATPPAGWQPDLVKTEDRITAALLIRL